MDNQILGNAVANINRLNLSYHDRKIIAAIFSQFKIVSCENCEKMELASKKDGMRACKKNSCGDCHD